MEKRHISSRYKISARSVKVPARHIDGVYERPLKITTKKAKVVVQEKPTKTTSSNPKAEIRRTAVSSDQISYQQPSPTYNSQNNPPIVHRIIHEYYQTVSSAPTPVASYPQYTTAPAQNQRQFQSSRQMYSQPVMRARVASGPMYSTPMSAPKVPKPQSKVNKFINKIGKNSKKTGARDGKLNPSDIIRYAVVTVFVVLAGYLAYDTWQTNQQVQNAVRGDSASAQSYESSADVSNPPISNGESYPEYKVAADQPRILAIPSINVTARMMSVGLTSGNKVEVPSDASFAGWYTGASKPGEEGAAFVTGHYNGPNAGGVFDNLNAIALGDQITIEMGDGSIKKYKVVERETVSVGQVDMAKALSVINGKDEGLNIMTCAGAFTSGGFTDRLTVYAERV